MNKVLYIFHFGDQHTQERINTISDGGSNIHVHLIQEFVKEGFAVDISTYRDNYLYQHYFSEDKRVTMREFFTFSALFKRCLVYYEILWRCLYPGLLFLGRRIEADYLVTQTDFLPDVIVALFIKLRKPTIVWTASYFLDAPKPWDRHSPYRGKNWIVGLFYWLWQRPSYWLVRSLADYVLVTSVPDVEKFVTEKRERNRVIVVRGGVEIEAADKYWQRGEITPLKERKYDACFMGRFHYQKGVLELMDIWRLVCRERPRAKLALIGHGALEGAIRQKIKLNNLAGNVEILGYLTGEPKFAVFRQSQMILHPATYDSGGMAAAEAMAWGLPGVSFDLESLKTYYPQGMLKTPCFDLQKFADNILKLLENPELYERLSQEAHALIVRDWDWNQRAAAIVGRITGRGSDA
jgi:glycosyltransferase involved in cell wall biosynthesis